MIETQEVLNEHEFPVTKSITKITYLKLKNFTTLPLYE